VALEPLAPEAGVAENRGHVGVAREDPEAVRRPVDRVRGAEARVARIGIGDGRGIRRAEEAPAVDRPAVDRAADHRAGDSSAGGWLVDPDHARVAVVLRRRER
jgi:hypothetical protein